MLIFFKGKAVIGKKGRGINYLLILGYLKAKAPQNWGRGAFYKQTS
jgi:hypothetical protein